MEDDLKLIRQLESELLDQYHKKFPILRRPSHESIPYFLKNLGDIQRDLAQGVIGKSGFGRRTFWNTVIQATGYCLRWALQQKSIAKVPFTSHDDLSNQAGDLLDWAVSYSLLSADHVAMSRGIIKPHVDRENKVISFLLPESTDHAFLFSQIQAYERETAHSLTQQPLLELHAHYIEWKRKSRFGFRERLSSFFDQGIPPTAFYLAYSWLRATLLPELPDDLALANYTLEEYRKIFACLFVVSQFQAWDEETIDKSLGPDNFAGSVVIVKRAHRMVTWLSQISGVPYLAVKHFVEDHTLDSGSLRSTLSTTFFIHARNDELFFLARLPSALLPNQVLTSILSYGINTQVYDRLVQQLEKRNVELLERRVVSSQNWKVFRSRTLKLRTGSITPDLIIVDKTGEVLLIEYKHVLSPLSPIQVVSRVKNYAMGNEGIQQVRKYLTELNSNKQAVAYQLGLSEVQNATGLIVFGNPMPIPLPETIDVLKIDKYSLDQYLSSITGISIADLVSWITKLKEEILGDKSIRLFPREIRVSDWTYVHWYTAIEDRLN